MEIGVRLRMAREKAGYSQQRAGVELGFQGQAGYRRWEAGEVSAPVSGLMNAAVLFGTTLVDLVAGEPATVASQYVAEPPASFLNSDEEGLIQRYRSASPAVRRAVWAALGA